MSDPIQAHLDRLYTSVEEALRTLHANMPWDLQIPLADGRVLRLKKFGNVEKNAQTGRWEFGFDLADDNTHFEFMVKHTGGGGMVPPDLAGPINQGISKCPPQWSSASRGRLLKRR